jgi:phosphomannomutase/phosphoglucomutase
MDLNQEIFRQYDIRGTVEEDLTDETVSVLGRAMGSYLCEAGATKISVASDNRLSSDGFRAIISEELVKSGLHVVDFGVIPTPVFYYTLFECGVKGGVMITGSQKIRQIAEKGRYTVGKGSSQSADAKGQYIDRLFRDVKISRNMRVALDCGNGTAGIIVPDLLSRYNISCEYLYCEPDGTYPNHHPDPTMPQYLEDLIDVVRKGSYEIGIAYDGDADRIGVIDENGGIIWGDRLLIIFARDILARHHLAKVIFEVKCSQALVDAVEKAGGIPIMWKTGHSLIKSKMVSENALLAGEMSGHIFFKDRYYGYDDAIYASLRLLEILSRQDVNLSSLLSDVPRYYATPEIRINCPDKAKFRVIEKLKDHLVPGHKIIDIDGVRVVYEDGWGLARASNTQPVLVLRFEAGTRTRLEEIQQELLKALREVAGGDITLPEE